MQIEINNKNSIITDAFFERTELSLSLFINTKKAKIDPDYISSGTCPGGEWEEKYYFYVTPESTKYDSVSLIAETPEETEVLKYISFNSCTKNQQWYLYCANEVWKNK